MCALAAAVAPALEHLAAAVGARLTLIRRPAFGSRHIAR